jgi:hypothetical protein
VHQKSGLKGGVAFDWRDLVKGGLLYFFFVMKLLFFYQQEIYGYVGNKVKKVLIWILIFLTVGFLRLFFFWFPHLMIAATHDSSSLKDAETVVLKVSRFPFHFKYFVITDKEMKKNRNTTLCMLGQIQNPIAKL